MGKGRKNLVQGSNELNLVLFEPDSKWQPPSELPDLSDAKIISIDSETRDPKLKEQGPGSFRKDGYPVGFNVSTDTGFSGYFPIAHLAGGNMDKERVICWLKDLLGKEHQDKVGTAIIYDLEWLASVGISVRGRIHDIQVAEALLDEERETGYSLDSIAKDYLGVGKDEAMLREAAAHFRVDPKGEMWKLHSRFVGPYAEKDALRTLQVLPLQLKKIEEQGLRKIYDMECAIIPIVWKMRQLGVRVDLEKAATTSKLWKEREDVISYNILMEHGVHLNPWSQNELAPICDRLKIPYPRTEKGGASFAKEFLSHNSHPFIKQVYELRRLNRLREVFVDQLIFGNHINGRVHCQFHQLRGDEYGVRGGRFSSSNPNLQQVPARDDELAPIIRSFFIPEEGCEWNKLDYSQQEPRILVHYAYICKLRGADRARQAYVDDPLMDYYKFTGEVANLPRRDSKTVTLGRFFGMGKRKLANDLGRPEQEAEDILNQYDEHNPYVSQLSEKCMRQADSRGYIRTMGGRVCHFDYWIPPDERFNPLVHPVKTLAKATATFPGKRLVRAHTHKAISRLIQGSAGDMTKLAMLHNYREYGAIPHLQVHDELDYSSQGMGEKYKFGMENCVKLEVPIVAELITGKHWK